MSNIFEGTLLSIRDFFPFYYVEIVTNSYEYLTKSLKNHLLKSDVSFECLSSKKLHFLQETLSLSITKLLRIFTNNRRNPVKIIYSNSKLPTIKHLLHSIFDFKSESTSNNFLCLRRNATLFLSITFQIRNRYKFLRIVSEIPGRNPFQSE